jgi:hypothetical protein
MSPPKKAVVRVSRDELPAHVQEALRGERRDIELYLVDGEPYYGWPQCPELPLVYWETLVNGEDVEFQRPAVMRDGSYLFTFRYGSYELLATPYGAGPEAEFSAYTG